MAIATMTEMWTLLDAYTLTPQGQKRQVNHLNEWGGYSRRLKMPVFTAWSDLAKYERDSKQTTALVCDADWKSAVGVNNQEHWLTFAEQNNNSVAAFFVIHAVDNTASPRQVESIDVGRAFVGKVVRDGSMTYIVGQPQKI